MATIVGSRTPLFHKAVPGGLPVILDGAAYTGNLFYVDSNAAGASDTAGHGTTPDLPFATVRFAVTQCTASQGDVILVLPGHSESLLTVCTLSIAGIKIKGLGESDARPVFTVTGTVDGFSLEADDIVIENVRFATPSAVATSQINIAASDCVVRKCSFIQGANSRDAITVTLAGEKPIIEDCDAIVTANGPDTFVEFEGVIDRPIVRRCVIIGSDGTNPYDTGMLDFNAMVITNAFIYDNVFGDGNAAVTVFADGAAVIGETIGINSYAALATNADTVGFPLSDNAITAAKIAAGAIGASEIATDAIDADALAADALAEIADAVLDEAVSGHVTLGTAGAMLQPLNSGSATAGAAGTITLAAAASATNDLYNGATIQIISGTGAGQARLISDYDGGTKIATVVPNWITNPAAGSIYVVLPIGSVNVAAIIDGTVVAADLAAGAIAAATFAAGAIDAAAIAAGAIDAGAFAAGAIDAAAIAAGAIDAGAFAAGAIDAAAIATDAIDADAIADNAITAGAIAGDAITNAKVADNTLASEQFALSAGEKTTEGIVVTRATAVPPQSTSENLFTVTGLCLLKRIVGMITVAVGAGANAAKLKVDSTGAGATTDICATLDIDGKAADNRLEITGTVANAMVATLDLPLAKVQVTDLVIPPGAIMLDCAGNSGAGTRIRWSVTYVPMESGAQIVAA